MTIPIKDIPFFTDHERFFKFIKIDQHTQCWDWIGEVSRGGYGRFYFKKIDNKNNIFSAHRVSWSIFNGELLKGKVIDHICMNKICVNPEHLRQVSYRTNVLENSNSLASKLKNITHCKNGHEYTIENTLTHPSRTSKEGVLWRSCLICVKQTKRKCYLRNKEKYNENANYRSKLRRHIKIPKLSN